MAKKPLSALMRLRTLRFITQKELADALGVTVNTVANWERGRAIPRLTPLQYKTLLRLLQITPDELPDDFGPPNSNDGQNTLTGGIN
jgi:DNA-binding transcriptional regulator YiaG